MIGSTQTESQLDEDRLRRLIDAGRSLVAERELEGVFDRLLLLARELTDARHAAIGVLDEDRQGLGDLITTSPGIGPDASPPDDRLLARLIKDPAPLRLSEVSSSGSATSFLGVPILIRGEVWGNLYLTDKPGGGSFDEADEEATVVLAAWAGIAVENARLYRETDQRRVELERSLRALEATSEIAQAVGGETRLWRVLEMIARRSRALVEASGALILLSDGEEFEIAATAGRVRTDLIGIRLAAAGSVAARVLATGQPERVSELASSERADLVELGIRPAAGLFVPLLFHGLQVGVIVVFDRVNGPHFRSEDERMLMAVGASAATAVATARSVERDRLRRSLKAAEAERSRWARELHDDTLQGLGVLRVRLSSARRTEDVGALHATLDGAVDQLAQEISNLRSLITELRPAALDELGLVPALEALFERARVAHGLVIEGMVELAEDTGPLRVDPEIETAVYRVVQESLTNAARHADAEYVAVEVLRRGDTIRIAVGDDGRGFAVGRPSTGFGLTGMRERVSLAGGRLEIKSSPAGTTILADLPCGDPSGRRR